MGFLILVSTAVAYEFALRPFSAPVHEAMSVAAEDCEQAAGDSLPAGCDRPGAWLRDHWRAPREESRGKRIRRWAGVRWSDNPGRSGGLGAVAASQLGGCERRVARGEASADTGFLCESHYGALQFFHAQPSKERDADGGFLEPVPTDAVTVERTVGWALFAYDHAVGSTTGTVADVLDGRYSAAFEASLRLAPLQGWTVEQLFTQRCEATGYRRCRSVDADSQAMALGAVLHVLQDSYSASHVRRLPRSGPLEPVVGCVPPTAFHRYQDDPRVPHDEHALADAWPTWDASCAGAVGPITASARVLRFVREHRAGTDRRAELEALVRDDVLGRETP